MEARVAFYFKIDTENLSDEQIAYMYSQIDYVLNNDYAIKNNSIVN